MKMNNENEKYVVKLHKSVDDILVEHYGDLTSTVVEALKLNYDKFVIVYDGEYLTSFSKNELENKNKDEIYNAAINKIYEWITGDLHYKNSDKLLELNEKHKLNSNLYTIVNDKYVMVV